MHASTFYQDFLQLNFQQGACAPQAPLKIAYDSALLIVDIDTQIFLYLLNVRQALAKPWSLTQLVLNAS